MIRLAAVCAVVLTAAGLMSAVDPAGASPSTHAVSTHAVSSATSTASSAGPAPVAPTYRNPLDLQLPDGTRAASCADPSVLHGNTGVPWTWYLYCTSDALTATEVGPSGDLVQHEVPMYTSTDLTHWRYAGDAFPTKPAWVTGDIWAPDVVFHDGRYLMYFTASDTEINGGGSAIGVASSMSPTGPWEAISTPVVAPSVFADGTRWNFDPEVVYVGARAYVYFGSYFGGITVRELGPDGLTSDPATETPIAIDNRYEGTFIVRRNGWFYFMGSATNCCNGPLTGYAVFVA